MSVWHKGLALNNAGVDVNEAAKPDEKSEQMAERSSTGPPRNELLGGGGGGGGEFK